MATSKRGAVPAPIQFRGELSTIDGTTLVLFPEEASRQLPSRGQVAVRVTVDGHEFETVAEPDGRRGHWLRIEPQLQSAAGLGPGDSADLTAEVLQEWPEPDVPEDLSAALRRAPADIRDMWEDLTPMARWEWVRWVRSTNNPETRQHRVTVSVSKMESGKRRPCCFDLSSCTDPDLARSGKLRQPS